MTSVSVAYSAVVTYVYIYRLSQEMCRKNCVWNRFILGLHGQTTELFQTDKWTVNYRHLASHIMSYAGDVSPPIFGVAM